MGRRQLKMKNVKLKIIPSSLPSNRTDVISLKNLYQFSNSVDVSHPYNMTKLEFSIRKAT
ncbi:MAG TPA: hypothetical protein DF712_07120 [Balneola sp.]|nr:hypothetical protein [Bacteroidota bacterium]HCT52217.1 hypothetical protein [Balneola sp.]